MTKPASTTKKQRKQHAPEFRQEDLKLAERIGVAEAARELSLYDESQLYNWRSKQQNQHSSSEREYRDRPPEAPVRRTDHSPKWPRHTSLREAP